MQNTTRKKRSGFVGSILSAAAVSLYMLLVVALVVRDCAGLGEYDPIAQAIVILVCVLPGLAIVVGAVVAVFQRWQEIRGGEEDEARKY